MFLLGPGKVEMNVSWGGISHLRAWLPSQSDSFHHWRFEVLQVKRGCELGLTVIQNDESVAEPETELQLYICLVFLIW